MTTSQISSRNGRCRIYSRCRACIFLGAVMTTYTFLGALFICYLEESDHNRKISPDQIADVRATLFADLNAVCENNTANRTVNFISLFTSYEKMLELSKHKTHRQHWNLVTAILFCVSVTTTIGYGYTVPMNTSGRCFSMVYALIGIPMNLIFLSEIGKAIGDATKSAVKKVRSKLRKRHGKHVNGDSRHDSDIILDSDLGVNWILTTRQHTSSHLASTRHNYKNANHIENEDEQPTYGHAENSRWDFPDHGFKEFEFNIPSVHMNQVWPIEPADFGLDSDETEIMNDRKRVQNSGKTDACDYAKSNFSTYRIKRQRNPDIFTIYASDGQPALPATLRPDVVGPGVTAADRTSTECSCKTGKGRGDDENVPYTVLGVLLIGYSLFGALIFQMAQGWTFFTAFYFCVITLTTIGFGDVQLNVTSSDEEYLVVFSCLMTTSYIMVGMALLSTCLNLTQDRIVAAFRTLTRRLEKCKSEERSQPKPSSTT
ncbi:potassium channel subfamily K member 18-like [Ptychodera flava]|uniref:potassium channel subfamily K member 18-like n=1 Tax=Ptychodera flava TaxID=63121 RepID=UPI00396A398F